VIILALSLLTAPTTDLNPPRVSHEPPRAADTQGNWRLWFEVRDESALFGAALYVAKPDGGWRQIEPIAVADGWLEVVIPGIAGTRYFFEVFDINGNGPSRVGSAEVPFVLAAPKGVLASRPPWVKQAPIPSAPLVSKPSPWWLKRPSDTQLYGLAGGVALVGLTYAGWSVLRRHPISKVTLVPVGQGSLP
jgi:hypothetical protein